MAIIGNGIAIQGSQMVAGNLSAVATNSVVTAGRILNLDAGNPASYPGSGNTWTDTVSSRAFTLFNSPTYSSDNGGYLTFTQGSSQYAYCTSSFPTALTSFTLEAWNYFNGHPTAPWAGLICEKYPGPNGNAVNYVLGSTGLGTTGNSDIQLASYGSGWHYSSAYTLTTGSWYYLAGTYDGTTFNLYVNNSLVGTRTDPSTPTSSGGGIYLMRRWDSADFWYGNLSIANIYNTALTSTQINQNWTALKSRFGL